MLVAIDLGGSTIDVLTFDSQKTFVHRASFESAHTDKSDLRAIIAAANINLTDVTQIALTGGHSRIFADHLDLIPITRISEIDAIGKGGGFLTNQNDALICSLGTGTCCVSWSQNQARHVGGTGIGGGSLLGLGKTILGVEDFTTIRHLIAQGNAAAVDISVAEIVGGGIGMVPGSATASNFAKANQASAKADLARGIANLIGQTIASIAVFAARAEHHQILILGGKLVRVPEIVEVIQKTAAIYNCQIIVPEYAELMSAVGAGVLAGEA